MREAGQVRAGSAAWNEEGVGGGRESHSEGKKDVLGKANGEVGAAVTAVSTGRPPADSFIHSFFLSFVQDLPCAKRGAPCTGYSDGPNVTQPSSHA